MIITTSFKNYVKNDTAGNNMDFSFEKRCIFLEVIAPISKYYTILS